jgi:hypothetical protein
MTAVANVPENDRFEVVTRHEPMSGQSFSFFADHSGETCPQQK